MVRERGADVDTGAQGGRGRYCRAGNNRTIAMSSYVATFLKRVLKWIQLPHSYFQKPKYYPGSDGCAAGNPKIIQALNRRQAFDWTTRFGLYRIGGQNDPKKIASVSNWCNNHRSVCHRVRRPCAHSRSDTGLHPRSADHDCRHSCPCIRGHG